MWIERGYRISLHFVITLFNVGNILLRLIYQLNFAVFMYVNTNITLYIVFGIIPGFT